MQGYINKDFKWSEFISDKDKPSQEILDNIKRVAYVLSIYKHKLFNGQPITITSGYRSPQHQIEVYRQKGITDKSKIPMGSYHLKGLAADFIVKGFTPAQIYRILDIRHWGGLELAPTWTHLDLRGKLIRFNDNNKILAHHYNVIEHDKVFKP